MRSGRKGRTCQKRQGSENAPPSFSASKIPSGLRPPHSIDNSTWQFRILLSYGCPDEGHRLFARIALDHDRATVNSYAAPTHPAVQHVVRNDLRAAREIDQLW